MPKMGQVSPGDVEAAIAAHKADPSAHHAKYTDAEAGAIAAAVVAAHAALATVHQDAPALIATHTEIADAHHARYTDAEASAIADARLAIHAALATVHQDAPALIAAHAAIAGAHHAKTTSFTELTDRAGKDKLNWALNKLLLGAGPAADPTEIDLPVGGYTEGARVYHNVAQSIPKNVWTPLVFNSERYDTDTIHSTVTNNSRLTCKTAGKYVIVGNFEWADIPPTTYMRIILNDEITIGYAGYYTYVPEPIVSTVYDLAVNDFVELSVWQGSGSAVDVPSVAEYSPEFMMQRIG
ncbi:hypothetical protein ES707_15419 [subsurface metagenome]